MKFCHNLSRLTANNSYTRQFIKSKTREQLMSKQLIWKTNNIQIEKSVNEKVKHILYSTSSNISLSQRFEPIVTECIDQATSLLEKNLTDSSRYFMFEWHYSRQELTILVTDDNKTKDSTYLVKCQFTNSAQKKTVPNQYIGDGCSQSIEEDLSLRMRECIHNYMTTCSEFMQYSLIAVYHDGDREKARLV